MANEEPASGRVVADLSLRLRNLEAAIRNLKGWRRGLTLAGLGGMSATAFAPFYLLPAYVIAFVALVGFLDSAASQNKSHRRAFLTGWWFGSGFHLIGLHWLAFAFLVQAEQFAWMAPFAVVGMALFLGLFFGAACLLAHWIASTGPYRVVVLAASIALAEFVRGHILTGLPWNLPAQMMAGTATTAQPAAWLGPYGYSFIILVVAVSPVFVFNTLKTTALEKRLAFACLAPVAAYIAIYLGGSARMVILPEPEPTGVRVTVVQPNIPQKEKIDPSLWNRNIQKAIERSRDPETSSTTRYVIWPENAAPLLDENLSAQKAIAQSLSSNDILLTGAVRRGLETTNKWRVFNSILALEVDANAGIARPIASYDKHHLAPFGEYLPLRPLLTAIGLSQLAPYDEGFKAGAGPKTFEIGPAPFAPLICYETV
ncbi:MAG: apolipoprotein N-acyltransferase, partial [Pseudomonadota bacterium]